MDIICAKCGKPVMAMVCVSEDNYEDIDRFGAFCPRCQVWVGEKGEEIK